MKFACPSWVIPGSWAENLDFILSRPDSPVDGVELLVFDFDAEARAGLRADLPAITRAAERLELSLHLPQRLGPETMELFDMLGNLVRSCVIHPPKPGGEAAFTRFVRSALGRAERTGGEGMPALSLEYTDAAGFSAALSLLDDAGIDSRSFPVCMDTGHLLLEGIDPAIFALRMGSRLHRIHLHDIASEPSTENPARGASRMRDHAPLRSDAAWLAAIFPLLDDFPGLIELELFDWNAVLGSANLLRSMESGASGSGNTLSGSRRGPEKTE